jgi:rod shape-determining protein MreD
MPPVPGGGLGGGLDGARLRGVALMLALGVLAVYIEAAPLGVGPAAPPSPDLLLCVAVYWAAHRPRSTPLLAVFALGLMRDLMTDAPAGAGALALVLAAEAVKELRGRIARGTFLVEWMALAGAALGTSALMWLLVLLTFAQPPYLLDLAHQSLYTVLVFPLLAFAFRYGLRVSRRAEPA